MARILLLIFGIFCCSTSALMIRASHTDPVLLSALRLLIAAAALSPLFLRDLRARREDYGRRHLLATLLPGAVLGLHFISWIVGARMTPAANSTLIVNLVPVVMPLLLLDVAGERLSGAEWLATLVAVAGVGVLGASDFNASPRFFWGDVVCFGSMLLFALYLVLARRNRAFPSLWLYVVPLYAVAGTLCLLAAPAVARFDTRFDGREVLLILGLALVPTVLGHSILNGAMKRVRGQVVSLLNMGQFIFAGAMAYPLLGEVPRWPFYLASVMIVGGGALALERKPGRQRRPARGESAAAAAAAAPAARGAADVTVGE